MIPLVVMAVAAGGAIAALAALLTGAARRSSHRGHLFSAVLGAAVLRLGAVAGIGWLAARHLAPGVDGAGAVAAVAAAIPILAGSIGEGIRAVRSSHPGRTIRG